ncbi:MAG: sensor histidine kinase [Lachnospiraceae bacterium]
MGIISNVFELIANLIEGIIETQFFIRYLGYKSEKHKGITIGIMVGSYFAAVSFCNYLTYMSKYASFFTMGTWFILITILLKGRISEKLFLVGLHKIFICTISIMLFSLFDRWITYDSNGYMVFGAVRIILVIIAKLSEFLLLELVLHFRIKESGLVSNKIYTGLNGIILATLVSQEYLLDIIYQEAYTNQLANEAKVVVVTVLIIDVIVYVLCMNLTNSNADLLRERMKNAAFESKLKDIRLAKELHQQTMKIHHDMKNELLNIRLKLREGRIKEAEDYLEETLNVKLAKSNLVFTENFLVDSVINRCIEKCKDRGIVIENIIECSIDSMEEMDMAVLLSNLLDNAIEAAEQSEEKYVYLKISRMKNYLHIHVKNSCNGKVLKGEMGLQTTKKDKVFHGYGLLNVQDIVKKYNGEYEGNLNGREYVTNIALYLPNLTVQDRN